MDIYSLLDTVPTTLETDIIDYLMDYGKNIHFKEGEVVCREGDVSTMVHIILDGEANVIKGDSFGNSNIIATARNGSVFGEMEVFLNLHRSCSIVAKGSLSVLALKNEDFLGSLQSFPDLTLRLFKSLSLRLNSVNDKLANLLNTMSMVQLGTYILEKTPVTSGVICYDFDDITKKTELKRCDIVNCLINYNRLGIIDSLQLKEEERASFRTHVDKLRDYLQRISLKPAEA
jgi:CRP-like cAMP-binding protein